MLAVVVTGNEYIELYAEDENDDKEVDKSSKGNEINKLSTNEIFSSNCV